MNVFVDFHHTALLRSLILLFEGRLGGQVYRPIGMEWAEKGFWKVYDHPATQAQFLTLAQGYRPVDGTPPLNTFYGEPPHNLQDGVYYCADPENETYNKALTFEKFLEMDIDILVATIPDHIKPFQKIIRDYKPGTKLIFQVGNNWNVPEGVDIRNVMASANVQAPEGINFVAYHQEFQTDLFEPDFSVVPSLNMYSFVNCLPMTADWPLYETWKNYLEPTWQFRSYGGQCPDGFRAGVRGVSEGMREARAIWHLKPGGDGFGHVIHNAFAAGRPVIYRSSHYKGCLAEGLLVDGVTGIDLDACDQAEALRRIRSLEDDATWLAMARNAYAAFQKHVDYEAEEGKIRRFIADLS